MKDVLKRLKAGIEDEGCHTSKDFKNFTRLFKNRFNKEILKVGGTNHEQHIGHYCLSGFFDVKNQSYYYSIGDVRHFGVDDILIRTAQNHKDFIGGLNHYIPLGENMLIDNLPKW